MRDFDTLKTVSAGQKSAAEGNFTVLDAAKALTYLEVSVLVSTQPSLMYPRPYFFHNLSAA